MARGVTGALRAVKVVWRADYDYPEAFEREFEALKRYEPVSRRHPGLVPILQVGRNDEEGFYYYIMELADDVDKGRDFVPESYRPLTMMGRMRKQGRLQSEECLRHGVSVAEALHFMHENGLIHRDVKPSNLIFTDGTCRLADIGLVALLGQRSFVGTEGFVAPEGPGSPQSDIFSLGMVLYEASTGKDRLDFPDLPSSRESKEGLALWRRLHDAICRACAPKAADRFESAHQMALALRGEALPMRAGTRRKVLLAVMAVLAVAVLSMVWMNQKEEVRAALHRREPALVIKSEPPGAEIYSNGVRLGVTPLPLEPAEGVPAIYQVRLAGYRIHEMEHTASKKRPATYDLKLEPSKLPQPGERWENSLRVAFLPKQGGHTSERPMEMKFFDAFLKATGRPFEGRVVRYQIRGSKDPAYIVVVPSGDSEAFRYWLADRDREGGYLTNEHHYELEVLPYVDTDPAGPETPDDDRTEERPESRDWQAFFLRVERQGYGSIMVRTNPEGVKVYQGGELLGITPLEIPRVKTGEAEFDLKSDGYTDLVVDGDVAENEMLELYADMVQRRNVVYGREWRNSMGMKFIPTGEVLMAATETRRRDFAEYAKATGVKRPQNYPGQVQQKSAQFPVVGVDREEARAFCAWLTKKERDQKLIEATDAYRLPTDEEWSRAVGLPLERGKDPNERNGRIRGVYPWGYEWPPPKAVDNFADNAGLRLGGLTTVIPNFDDRFPTLAAVTAINPSGKGFVCLGGNVSEWVETDFESNPTNRAVGAVPMATARGGNWRSANPDELLSSARSPLPPGTKRDNLGFRVVLARGAVTAGSGK